MSAGAVGVVIDDTGHAKFRGLMRCGSVHECPCCCAVIKAGRADEVVHIVEHHGRSRAALVSLTIRHDLGDDLKFTRDAVATIAYRALTRGAAWKRFVMAVGLEGYIRAVEITYGPNGWHPHIHAVFLMRDGWQDARMPSGENAWDWFQRRWADVVARNVGEAYRPLSSGGIGSNIMPIDKGEKYLCKLGLEVSDPGTKTAKGGQRTPLQIAHDWAMFGRKEDAHLWQTFCNATKGTRQITYSRGLLRRFGLQHQTDAEVANADDKEKPSDIEIARIGADDWRQLRDRVLQMPTKSGRQWIPAPWALLRSAELYGLAGVQAILERLHAGEGRNINRRSKPRWKPKRAKPPPHPTRTTPIPNLDEILPSRSTSPKPSSA
jgi:hypothetical protein